MVKNVNMVKIVQKVKVNPFTFSSILTMLTFLNIAWKYQKWSILTRRTRFLKNKVDRSAFYGILAKFKKGQKMAKNGKKVKVKTFTFWAILAIFYTFLNLAKMS